SRVARRLGLDGNPLRRTDKIAACLAVLLVAVFVIGAPVLARAAVGWVSRVAAAEQPVARSWRAVPAVVRKAAPAPAVWEVSWVPARGTAPAGRHGPGRSRSGRRWPQARRSGCGWMRPGPPAGPPPAHELR